MSLSEDHRPRERLIREIRYSTKVSDNKVPGRKSVHKVFYLLSKKEEEKWEARRPP
jgi:transposase-like protein